MIRTKGAFPASTGGKKTHQGECFAFEIGETWLVDEDGAWDFLFLNCFAFVFYCYYFIMLMAVKEAGRCFFFLLILGMVIQMQPIDVSCN